MSNGKLKTACLGLGRGADELLSLARSTELYDIISIADSSLAAAQQVAQKFSCAAFDDYRQFTLQNQPDVLIVAEPLYKCSEFVKTAISKKCHILKLIPSAAKFEQAAELINLAEKNDVKYITACPARFAPGFERLNDYLKTVDKRQFYFINVCASFGDDFFQPIVSYNQADRKLSGGGVLLNDCFELISLIVENFSLPQQIYALAANKSADKLAKQYLGEDTITASLVFKNGLIGTFLAANPSGSAAAPPVRICGAENNIVATPNRLAVYDNDGTLINEHKYPLKPEKCITEMFIDVGRALLKPAAYKLRNSSRLDLATMAFIEAAYLSVKTATPESPGKFFEISEKEKSPFA
ncbi:MAG: Gfo/Idh/MocA family oxidoreductase [Sedimentisphaerales bacterium]